MTQKLDKLAEVSGLLVNLGQTLAQLGTEMLKEEEGPPLAEVPMTEPSKVDTPQALPKLEDVRKVLSDISRTGKTAEMKKLLTEFGAAKLSDIPAEKYPELLKAAEAIRDA